MKIIRDIFLVFMFTIGIPYITAITCYHTFDHAFSKIMLIPVGVVFMSVFFVIFDKAITKTMREWERR